jgi:hypothetical protein
MAMDTATWKAALAVFMSDPVPFTLAVLALMGLAWWLRGIYLKDKISALEERLRLAADEQALVTRKSSMLEVTVNKLEGQISASANLRDLATTTESVRLAVGELSHANSVLGSTLTLTSTPPTVTISSPKDGSGSV